MSSVIGTDHICPDEAIHNVPLITKCPDRAKAGRAVDAKLYAVDLTAMLCELTGGKAPDHYDGLSFATL
jgi:arylsulfatase A-like enzyme